jgi:hypothetical protein
MIHHVAPNIFVRIWEDFVGGLYGFWLLITGKLN